MRSTQNLTRDLTQEQEVWSSLKQAIATSSGFKRWQVMQQFGDGPMPRTLEEQVSKYLRETLETLAY